MDKKAIYAESATHQSINRSILYDKCTTEDDGGFFDVVMLITAFVSHNASRLFNFKGVGLPQRPDTTSFKYERGFSQRLPNPAHRKGSQDMTMRYDQNITFLVI